MAEVFLVMLGELPGAPVAAACFVCAALYNGNCGTLPHDLASFAVAGWEIWCGSAWFQDNAACILCQHRQQPYGAGIAGSNSTCKACVVCGNVSLGFSESNALSKKWCGLCMLHLRL
jgi:hypothetical protein